MLAVRMVWDGSGSVELPMPSAPNVSAMIWRHTSTTFGPYQVSSRNGREHERCRRQVLTFGNLTVLARLFDAARRWGFGFVAVVFSHGVSSRNSS